MYAAYILFSFLRITCQSQSHSLDKIPLLMLLQDFFTIGIGWILFGGLPFDIVSVNPSPISSLYLEGPFEVKIIFFFL